MKLGFSSWVSIVGGLLAVVFGGCELNPQPEVPNETEDGGGFGGVGNASTGGGGGLSLDGGAGTGGVSGTDSAVPGCAAACESGKLCKSGSCIDDPCEPNSCEADQACKPNVDFSASNCFESCAGVTCATGEFCVDGVCQPDECGGCAADEVCQGDADGGHACGVNPCETDAAPNCAGGEACNPANGVCDTDPCNGVKCPEGQACSSGQCQFDADASPTGDGG